MIYRVKTDRYTQSWMDFVVTEEDGQLTYQPIGRFYYTVVLLNLILGILLSQVLL
jgi:hypothetical protein